MDARDAGRIREGEEMSRLDELDVYVPLAVAEMVTSLEAEIEQLRADAGRYQWIRDRDVIDWDSLVYCFLPTGYEHPDNAINSSAMLLDAAIDAAMKEEK